MALNFFQTILKGGKFQNSCYEESKPLLLTYQRLYTADHSHLQMPL